MLTDKPVVLVEWLEHGQVGVSVGVGLSYPMAIGMLEYALLKVRNDLINQLNAEAQKGNESK